MTKLRILLDMDEVLTDFVGGAARAWGVEREDVIRYWPVGQWDMVLPLTTALAKKARPGTTVFPRSMSQEEFWARINGSADFWTGLDFLPWASNIISLVSNLTDDWHIVSSPSVCETSYDGKVKCLKRRFGNSFNRFCLTPHKHIFARPDVVLVDDRESNVEEFIRAGGQGIVFPTHHNTMHEFKDCPMSIIEPSLRRKLQCT